MPTPFGNNYTRENGVNGEQPTEAEIQNTIGDIDVASYNSGTAGSLRVSNLRGILGMPPQFLPDTDLRLYGDNPDDFGRVYTERIIKNIPLLLLIPGVPKFNGGDEVLGGMIGSDTEGNLAGLNSEGSGKLYSLKFAYQEYYEYVNIMLRTAAQFLGVGKYASYNWRNYGNSIFGGGIIKQQFSSTSGAVALYADCGTDTSDSFGNSTTTSSLASSINSLSDQARELNFLLGNVTGMLGAEYDKYMGMENLESNIENAKSMISGLGLGSNNIFSTIIGKAQTILAGGRLIFPEIWADSSFGRSYSCKMKLIAPAGDKCSVFLNILVPLYHVLALCLPRESISQAYYSPFLIRAYYKGLFNIDMGIMTDLSVTKGAEGEWTLDGIPTVAELSFSIKDLYEELSMVDNVVSLFSNTAELDYIANSCGININDRNVLRNVSTFAGLVGAGISNMGSNIINNVGQYVNQKLQNLFGAF